MHLISPHKKTFEPDNTSCMACRVTITKALQHLQPLTVSLSLGVLQAWCKRVALCWRRWGKRARVLAQGPHIWRYSDA